MGIHRVDRNIFKVQPPIDGDAHPLLPRCIMQLGYSTLPCHMLDTQSILHMMYYKYNYQYM